MSIGTVPCLRCRREVRAHRDRCPFCGDRIAALPGVIVEGYAEGQIIRAGELAITRRPPVREPQAVAAASRRARRGGTERGV